METQILNSVEKSFKEVNWSVVQVVQHKTDKNLVLTGGKHDENAFTGVPLTKCGWLEVGKHQCYFIKEMFEPVNGDVDIRFKSVKN